MRWEKLLGIAATAWVLTSCAAGYTNSRYGYNGFNGFWRLDVAHSDQVSTDSRGYNGYRDDNGYRSDRDRDRDRDRDQYGNRNDDRYDADGNRRDSDDSTSGDSDDQGYSQSDRGYGGRYGSDRSGSDRSGYDRYGNGRTGWRAGMLPDAIRISSDRGDFRIQDTNGTLVSDIVTDRGRYGGDRDRDDTYQGSYSSGGVIRGTGQWVNDHRFEMDSYTMGDRRFRRTFTLDGRDRLVVVTDVQGARGSRTFTRVYDRVD